MCIKFNSHNDCDYRIGSNKPGHEAARNDQINENDATIAVLFAEHAFIYSNRYITRMIRYCDETYLSMVPSLGMKQPTLF